MTEQFANTSIGFLENDDFEKDDTKAEGEKGILKMSKGNNNLYMTMVFANWCGPCKMAKPYYKALSKFLNENNIKTVFLTCINATGDDTQRPSEKLLNENMMTLIGVRGFPTFLFFKDGKKTKYEGRRSVTDFIKGIASLNEEVASRKDELLPLAEKADRMP
jgi:thiol-disulfide isomerase/thioredoxin